MWVHNLDPVLVPLGPVEIRWYGLVYVFGFLLSIWWLQYMRKQGKLDLTSDEIWDFMLYLIIGVLVGARLFMIFWQPADFLAKPWNLLRLWEGGMSFHGGFVGVVAAAWWYSKKKKLNFWKLADMVSVPAIFALALGRIANFINGELVGRVWNGQWCVVFPDFGEACRHPSTLYAAGKRFIVFGWLVWLSVWKEFKPGFIFWNFVMWEGLGRIIVDFYRENAVFAGFSLGQWFSVIMVIVGVIVFRKDYVEDWKNIFKRERKLG